MLLHFRHAPPRNRSAEKPSHFDASTKTKKGQTSWRSARWTPDTSGLGNREKQNLLIRIFEVASRLFRPNLLMVSNVPPLPSRLPQALAHTSPAKWRSAQLIKLGGLAVSCCVFPVSESTYTIYRDGKQPVCLDRCSSLTSFVVLTRSPSDHPFFSAILRFSVASFSSCCNCHHRVSRQNRLTLFGEKKGGYPDTRQLLSAPRTP